MANFAGLPGHPLTRAWGAVVLQGAIAILFGLLFLAAPVTTLVVAVYLFGAFAVADGILAFVAIFSKERTASGWLLAVYGVIGVAVGVIAFAWPGITAAVFLTLVAVWALLIGIFRIGAAIALRREIEGEWLLALGGVISVLFGLYVLFAPGGLEVLVLAIGIYAIIKGIVLVASGLRLRRLGRAAGRYGAGPGGGEAAA